MGRPWTRIILTGDQIRGYLKDGAQRIGWERRMGESTGTPLSVRVVRSIADARDVEPAELEFRLGDAIDTDALDAMDAHGGDDWQLAFEVEGHEVTVAPDGPVTVDGMSYR